MTEYTRSQNPTMIIPLIIKLAICLFHHCCSELPEWSCHIMLLDRQGTVTWKVSKKS